MFDHGETSIMIREKANISSQIDFKILELLGEHKKTYINRD